MSSSCSWIDNVRSGAKSGQYLDIFNNPQQSYQLKILSTVFYITVILFTALDAISNVIILFHLWTYFSHEIGLFITYSIILLISSIIEVRNFIISDKYSETNFKDTKIYILVLVLLSWFLPYFRMIQFGLNSEQNQEQLKKLINNNTQYRKFLNQNNFLWTYYITTEMQCFTYRNFVCTTLLFFTTLILICVDPKIINTASITNINNNNNNNDDIEYVIYGFVMVLSSVVKVMCFLISCVFWMLDSESYGFVIYVYIVDCLCWCCDVMMHLVNVFTLTYCLIFLIDDYVNENQHSNNDNTGNSPFLVDFASILVQLYYYPLFFFIIMPIVVFGVWLSVVIETWLAEKIGSKIVVFLVFILFIPVIVSLVLLGFGLEIAFITLILNFVCFNIVDLDDMRTYYWYCNSIGSSFSSNKEYKHFFNLMTRICYYLINDVKCTNLSSKCKYNFHNNHSQQIEFYQQIGCINYELIQHIFRLESCEYHTQYTNTKEEIKRHVSKKYFDYDYDPMSIHENTPVNEKHKPLGKFWRDLYLSQNESLMTDICDKGLNFFTVDHDTIYTRDSEGNEFTHYLGTSPYTQIFYNTFFYFRLVLIDYTDYISKLELKSKYFDMLISFFIINVMISRLNLILFPIYCSICMFISNYTYNGNRIFFNNIEMFIGILVCIVIFFYITAIYMQFKYVFPLYWKLTFILPLDRIANVEFGHSIVSMRRIEKVFKKTERHHINQVFEAILLRIEALKMRPKKIKVIENILGNDIGHIVVQYLPICDYKICPKD